MTPFLFAYGTLMVGHCRWPILEPFVVGGPRPATAGGRLFDTGFDYPAARFDLPGVIHGQLLGLVPGRASTALAVLDEVEGGVEGDYRRVEIGTDLERAAWSYQYGGAIEGLVDLDGRWSGV